MLRYLTKIGMRLFSDTVYAAECFTNLRAFDYMYSQYNIKRKCFSKSSDVSYYVDSGER